MRAECIIEEPGLEEKAAFAHSLFIWLQRNEADHRYPLLCKRCQISPVYFTQDGRLLRCDYSSTGVRKSRRASWGDHLKGELENLQPWRPGLRFRSKENKRRANKCFVIVGPSYQSFVPRILNCTPLSFSWMQVGGSCRMPKSTQGAAIRLHWAARHFHSRAILLLLVFTLYILPDQDSIQRSISELTHGSIRPNIHPPACVFSWLTTQRKRPPAWWAWWKRKLGGKQIRGLRDRTRSKQRTGQEMTRVEIGLDEIKWNNVGGG